MAKNFNELRAKMSPESRARAQAKFEQLVKEMPLEELRAARELTQEQLAKTLGTSQAAVSKLERRADMYVSTLAHFVKAMGGELQIRAVFPDGTVSISRLGDLDRIKVA
jgi:DNA-binding XRE family transcriptional regulator